MQLGLSEAPIGFAPFERRLNANDAAPLAVALSGGGNSLALMLMAKRWADRAGRRLIAFTVDHGLQAHGAAWADWAADRARRLGVAHRSLRWDGEKPSGGLPAAARGARHRLLAEAARAAGARVILLGHTADDRMEAEMMRAAGSTVPTAREWSPSPVWPEGRGLFLLRPLLAARRADLRAWLAAAGEPWIDDPANDDPRFARTLARRRLASSVVSAGATDLGRASCCVPADMAFGSGGEFTLPRGAFAGLDPVDAGQRLSALCLCASGRSRPPRAEALARLAQRLAASGDFTAVLAGARIEARAGHLLICREAGEFRRAGLGEACLPAGESVFDGRFLLTTADPGWTVQPLRGRAKRLALTERSRLADLPAAVRGGLPVVAGPRQAPTCPVLAQDGPIRAVSLGRGRLLAALGAIQNEASIERVAKLRRGA